MITGAFRGAVHLPGSEQYDAHRVTLNPALDPRPAVVVEAVTPADVRNAVLAARRHDLPLAVQSTGHGTLVPADGGLLVKTTAMAEVLVNPARRIARVGPGARWADVIAAAAPFGLAPVSGSSTSVGVTGYTFGGGLGWLSRRHGLAADSLGPRRPGHRRRPAGDRERGPQPGPVLGDPRRRRQLRPRHRARVPAAPGVARVRRHRVLPAAACRRRAGPVPGLGA